MKPYAASLALAALILGMLAGTCAGQDEAKAALSPEVQAAADVLNKAPFALILATGQHYLDTKRWPTERNDIAHVLEANRSVLPKSFDFRKVEFTSKSRKECAIHFAFDWPTLEGGGVEGTIVMGSGGSLKEMAKTAKISWKTQPKMRADLMPDAPPTPPPATQAGK